MFYQTATISPVKNKQKMTNQGQSEHYVTSTTKPYQAQN